MRTLLIAALFCLGLSAGAQKSFDNRPKIGVVLGSGKNEVVNYKPLSGSGGRDGKGYFLVGVTYLIPLKKWLDLETALEFSRHKIRAGSAPMPGMWYWNTDASIISVPVNARFNFLKYFFAQGGLLLDIDVSDNDDLDKQTGIGASIGLGGRYDFTNRFSLFANPYLKHHALLAFDNNGRGVFSNDMVSELGVRLGLLYSLGK